MKGLEIYNKVRKVPVEAKKTIFAGRLKGMSDINPMWRIKVLTEQFGPCGIGWYYEIVRQWLEEGSAGQRIAFCNINLFIKDDKEWSMPIPGTGGSSFISNEKKGPYTNDECFKMALTDAISISCKALGIAADVYFEKDRTKYDIEQPEKKVEKKINVNTSNSNLTEKQLKRLYAIAKGAGFTVDNIKYHVKTKFKLDHLHDLTKAQYDIMCNGYEKNQKKKK